MTGGETVSRVGHQNGTDLHSGLAVRLFEICVINIY